MPLYSYRCVTCNLEAERLVRQADRETPTVNCSHCGGPLAYAGLSLPAMGREQRFGAILEDGTRIKGGLDRVKRGSTRV